MFFCNVFTPFCDSVQGETCVAKEGGVHGEGGTHEWIYYKGHFDISKLHNNFEINQSQASDPLKSMRRYSPRQVRKLPVHFLVLHPTGRGLRSGWSANSFIMVVYENFIWSSILCPCHDSFGQFYRIMVTKFLTNRPIESLPPATKLGNVFTTCLSVILFTEGEGGGSLSGPGQRPAWTETPWTETPQTRDPPGQRPPEHRPPVRNERAVRILLECILVGFTNLQI